MGNSYQVINASAGSGKTYTLVQRVLMICLKTPGQHTAIRNILALTFTNKAATEMKERILLWLSNFVKPNYAENPELNSIKNALDAEGIYIDIHELHARSQKLLDYILHNYSTLNIGTIDRFNSRLVRSFSNELGLAKNFNLEINPEPLLLEAVDKMLDQIGENDPISDSFMDYVNYSLDNEKKVNLNKTLYDASKEFLQDVHYDHLKKNSDFTDEKYAIATQILRRKIGELKKENKEIATSALALIKEKNLENSDFAGGGKQSIQYFFDSFIEKGIPLLNESPEKEENKIKHYLKGSSKSGIAKHDTIMEIIDFLLLNRSKIIENYIETEKNERILSALLPLKVNADIQNELAKIEDEQDVVLLSKFNVLINENLSSEPSQFIYEKVGTKFQHFFFDEFQDTSTLQWRNFVPLRDHSISSDDTSFTLVGDPKQSIYRFRGGDSSLMLDIIAGNEGKGPKAETLVLKNNFRSAQNIVDFNNKLYGFIAKQLKGEHRNIFGENAQQNAVSKKEGLVQINLIERGNKDEFLEAVTTQMQMDIQKCLEEGYSFSDITILCRGNTEIFHYTQLLESKQVEYKGKIQNIKTISESGLTLNLSPTLNAVINFLNWETNSANLQFLVLMMYWLNKSGRIATEDFTAEMLQIIALENKNEIATHIKQKFGVTLFPENFPKLNLYNFVEYYIHEFSVEGKETVFLLNFLETLYGFNQNSGATIKDFLKFWNEEAQKNTIQTSDNLDAVQLMTIHKAKGLEFPVLLLPMQNSSKDSSFTEWFDTHSDFGLKSVHMHQFSKGLDTYDEEIRKFNEENSYKNLIDRICVLYVATTRAKDGMFLYLEKPGLQNHLEIYDFVMQNRDSSETSFAFENKGKLINKVAEKEPNLDEQEIMEIKILDSIRNHHEKLNNLKIATPSKSYREKNPEVKAGIFVHEILSKITDADELNPILENYVMEGFITSEEMSEVKVKIEDVISRYPQYFSKKNKIMNERDVMVSTAAPSKTFRPDRMIFTEDGIIILDFKTGKPEESHQIQIENYREILESFGKKIAGTEIIYI